MLGKLLKYEFQATGRVLLPIYGILLLAALATNLFITTNLEMAQIISMLVFVGLCVAAMVLTIIITVQRFGNNLLKDEGYLMFTLPVGIDSLIASKIIVALCWAVLGTIIGMIGGMLMVMSGDMIRSFFSEFPEFWRQLMALVGETSWQHWTFLLEVIFGSLIAYCTFLMTIYLSLSVGQLPFAGKHRNLFALITFFVIYIIYINIAAFIGNNSDIFFMDTAMYVDHYANLTYTVGNMGIALLIDIIAFAILYVLTRFILKKHLNLE